MAIEIKEIVDYKLFCYLKKFVIEQNVVFLNNKILTFGIRVG